MNIHYQSDNIQKFYSAHRTKWADFYASEQFVFERVFSKEKPIQTVLDVGCASGGLGTALAERFGVDQYFGVDINPQAISAATAKERSGPQRSRFICGDIAQPLAELENRKYDLVCCLGCADWNLEPLKIISRCWDFVGDDGEMIISLRLTKNATLNDICKSYQFIHFDASPPTGGEERANYVVFNIGDAFGLINNLAPRPSHTLVYGYWGKPSRTAVTRYSDIVFSVFALRKKANGPSPTVEVRLPLDALSPL